jgi:hypothetical protein
MAGVLRPLPYDLIILIKRVTQNLMTICAVWYVAGTLPS